MTKMNAATTYIGQVVKRRLVNHFANSLYYAYNILHNKCKVDKGSNFLIQNVIFLERIIKHVTMPIHLWANNTKMAK